MAPEQAETGSTWDGAHVVGHCCSMAVGSTADSVSTSRAQECPGTLDRDTGMLAGQTRGSVINRPSGLDCSAAAGASFFPLGLGTR